MRCCNKIQNWQRQANGHQRSHGHLPVEVVVLSTNWICSWNSVIKCW